MTVGEKIMKLRKSRGWSQEDFADRIGVSRQAVSRWESNSTKPDADKIVDICDLFDVSADYLLRENNPETEEWLSSDVPGNTRGQLAHMTPLNLLGVLLIVICTLFWFVLGILNALEPWRVVVDDRTYTGLTAYIMAHDMVWLVFLDICGILIGVYLLLKQEDAEQFRQYWKTCWSDFKELFRER